MRFRRLGTWGASSVVVVLALSGILGWPLRALGQESGTGEIETRLGGPEPYRESALRRFEIVTLTSLPFAAIHSYLVVRGYRAATSGSLTTGLRDSDWNAVGVGAAVFAIGIGVYDYMRMRGKDRTELLLPEPARTAALPASHMPSIGGIPPLARLAWRF